MFNDYNDDCDISLVEVRELILDLLVEYGFDEYIDMDELDEDAIEFINYLYKKTGI